MADVFVSYCRRDKGDKRGRPFFPLSGSAWLAFPPIEEGEILARETGFNARVFTDEANAVMWLRHGEA